MSNPKLIKPLMLFSKKSGFPVKPLLFRIHFQLEAVDLVQNDDVLVSAPTGSGKTWIAVQTIRSYLSRGLNVWYASPLKALSNSIYQEFAREFGSGRSCGILTGDRKENADAPRDRGDHRDSQEPAL